MFMIFIVLVNFMLVWTSTIIEQKNKIQTMDDILSYLNNDVLKEQLEPDQKLIPRKIRDRGFQTLHSNSSETLPFDGNGVKVRCQRNRCYHFVERKLSFHNAEKYCVDEFDGNLASITTSVEFNDVIQMLDDFKSEDEEIYIGAVEKKSRWVWTSGEPWSNVNWAPFRINNRNAIVLTKNPSWRFADVPSSRSLPFLCESDLLVTQNSSRVVIPSRTKQSLEEVNIQDRLELQGLSNFGLPFGNFHRQRRHRVGQQFNANFINQLYNEHNIYRRQSGLPALQPDRNIENILRRLSSITTGVGHDHNQMQNLQNHSVQRKGCRRTAENLAWNSRLNARNILQQWKNSPGHNRNILTRQAGFIGCANTNGGNFPHAIACWFCFR